MFLRNGLGHEGDDEHHQGRKDEGEGREVEKVEIADGLLDPLGPGVWKVRSTRRFTVTKLQTKTNDANCEASQNAPESTLKESFRCN